VWQIHLLIIFISSWLAVGAFAEIKQVPCGKEWVNIHKDNPDLIGVYVQQFPDSKADRKAYEGKHPALVIFIFNGYRAHQLEYTPSGQAETGFWWNIPENHWLLLKMNTDLKPNVVCGF
jgi:hypothetical protein